MGTPTNPFYIGGVNPNIDPSQYTEAQAEDALHNGWINFSEYSAIMAAIQGASWASGQIGREDEDPQGGDDQQPDTETKVRDIIDKAQRSQNNSSGGSMGSFWGMSDAGKQAEGFPQEYGNYSYEQFKKLLDQSEGLRTGRADPLINDSVAFMRDKMQWGFPGADQVKATGESIMPVDPVIAARQGRLNQIGDVMGTAVPWQETTGSLEGKDALTKGVIGHNQDLLTRDVEDQAGRMLQRGDTGTQDIIGMLQGSYGGLGDQINAGYGGARAANVDAFQKMRDQAGGLFGKAGNAFTDTRSEIEKTRPVGDFAVARNNRAFAPMARATAANLRRGRVDFGSPEAAEAMNKVYEAKGRSADDTYAQEAGRFADRVSNVNRDVAGLNLAEQRVLEGLGRGQLGNEIGLGTAQTDATVGLGREVTGAVAGLKGDNLASQQAIDAATSGMKRDIQDTGTQRFMKNIDDSRVTELMKRGMSREDALQQANLLREKNAEDLVGLGLRQDQFNTGLDFTKLNEAIKSGAAGTLLGQGNQDYSNSLRAADMSRGFGNDALRAQLAQYGIELPNAGWGRNLLINGGMAAANAFLPGSGALAGLLKGGGGNSTIANPMYGGGWFGGGN